MHINYVVVQELWKTIIRNYIIHISNFSVIAQDGHVRILCKLKPSILTIHDFYDCEFKFKDCTLILISDCFIRRVLIKVYNYKIHDHLYMIRTYVCCTYKYTVFEYFL